MSFCTVVNCIDGRVQLPVITFLKKRFNAKYVDNITEPGPVLILSGKGEINLVESILNRVQISIEKHGSTHIALVAHYDCAGNPKPKQTQITQLKKAISFLKGHFKDLDLSFIGLWVNENWLVEEVE